MERIGKRVIRTRGIPPQRRARPGHVKPRPPVIDLNGPGRLRSAHVLAVCGIAHSTLYARIKAGTFPPPDGRDGGLIYWNTETIRRYLAAEDYQSAAIAGSKHN